MYATSHIGVQAIDFGSNNAEDRKLYAPFTGTIKAIFNPENAIAFESNEPVTYADGVVDYMSIMTAHDNNVSNLYVGKVIKQGEYYTDMGNAGNATGIHVHMEVTKGRWLGRERLANGNWRNKNPYNPFDALYLTSDTILSGSTYNWRRLPNEPIEELIGYPHSLIDQTKNELSINEPGIKGYLKPNIYSTVVGVLKEGVYGYYAKQVVGGNTWYALNEIQDIWVILGQAIELFPAKNLFEKIERTETVWIGKCKADAAFALDLNPYKRVRCYVHTWQGNLNFEIDMNRTIDINDSKVYFGSVCGGANKENNNDFYFTASVRINYKKSWIHLTRIGWSNPIYQEQNSDDYYLYRIEGIY